MNVDAVLDRIAYEGNLSRDSGTLRRLHRAFLFAVPFENLDIHLGRPIVIDCRAHFDKIIGERRGGFCYELNGLFGAFLRALGFRVTTLSARVVTDGRPGPAFDHMTLLVHVEDRWLADVGFGDSFRDPLLVDSDDDQADDLGSAFRLVRSGPELTLSRRDREPEWTPQYVFDLQAHQPAEFEPMCRYHQSSSDSSFTRRLICSRATPTGRVTLTDSRLITTTGFDREEEPISSLDDFMAKLGAHFGMTLPGPIPADFLRFDRSDA